MADYQGGHTGPEIDAAVDNITALYPEGAGSAGQVLTKKANGKTEWQTPVVGGNENVTLQLSVDSGSASVAGIAISVQVEGENAARSYTSDSNGQVKFSVSHGLLYTVTIADISGYLSIPVLSQRASISSRNLYGVYRVDASSTLEHVVLTLNYFGGGSARASAVNVITNAGTTSHAVVNNICEFDVTIGTNYTINFNAVSGYSTPINQSFTAAFRAKAAKVYYIGAVNDMSWVKSSDGSIVPLNELTLDNVTEFAGLRISSSLLGQQQASYLIPMDYLVKTNVVKDGVTLVTAKSIGTKTWGPSTLLLDLPRYTNESQCLTSDSYRNFDGQNMTTVYLAEAASKSMTLPAMQSARGTSITINGTTYYGFLGSYAQLKAFANNFTSIDNMLMSILGVHCISITSGDWWTGMQYNAGSAVFLYNGGFSYNVKIVSSQVVPLFAY